MNHARTTVLTSILTALAVVALSGCAGGPGQATAWLVPPSPVDGGATMTVRDADGTLVVENPRLVDADDLIDAAARRDRARAAAADEAVLAVGQEVGVIVPGQPGLSVMTTVEEDGALDLGELGRVPAAGRTVADVRDRVDAQLGDFGVNRGCRVEIMSTGPATVGGTAELLIEGGTRAHTTFDAGRTVADVVGAHPALAAAAGLTAEGRSVRVLVLRGADDGRPLAVVTGLRRGPDGLITGPGLAVQDGDLVVLPAPGSDLHTRLDRLVLRSDVSQ